MKIISTLACALVSVIALGCGGKSASSTPSNAGGTAAKMAAPTCTDAQIAVAGTCEKRCADDAECGEGKKCVEVDPGEMKRDQAEDGSFSGPVLEAEKYCAAK